MKKTLLLTLLALPLVVTGCDDSYRQSWKKVSKEDVIIIYTSNIQHTYISAEYEKLEYCVYLGAMPEVSVKYTLEYDTKTHIDIYSGYDVSVYYKDN